jgi:hypothetical protein
MAKEIKKAVIAINHGQADLSSASKLIHAHRGETKGGFRQMSYYLSEDLIKAIALKAAYSGSDKSQVVREALMAFLADELDDLKKR